jgi:hydroxymethylglutaryl-CoA lyase
MKPAVEIVEVGARDGLQNEPVVLTVNQKVQMLSALADAGVRRAEAVSFAHPKLVPQMADAEAVLDALDLAPPFEPIGLVMNWKGWLRAKATHLKQVNFPVATSATFNLRNQGATTAALLAVLSDIVDEANELGIEVGAVISTAFGCPFEGEISEAQLMAVAEPLANLGLVEFGIADTIGVGTPWDVTRRTRLLRELSPEATLRAHFHNTRNTGIANAYAAIEAGTNVLDSSIGGIGGCPFAPKATGNIPTDDLVYMLHREGIETGLNLGKLIEISQWLEPILGHKTPALLPKAGVFPASE